MEFIGTLTALSKEGKRITIVKDVPVTAVSAADAYRQFFEAHWDPELTTEAQCAAIVELTPMEESIHG